MSDSPRCIKREGSFLDRLDLQALAIWGLIQVIPYLRRTIGAVHNMSTGMEMMVDVRADWLRFRLVVMDYSTSCGRR